MHAQFIYHFLRRLQTNLRGSHWHIIASILLLHVVFCSLRKSIFQHLFFHCVSCHLFWRFFWGAFFCLGIRVWVFLFFAQKCLFFTGFAFVFWGFVHFWTSFMFAFVFISFQFSFLLIPFHFLFRPIFVFTSICSFFNSFQCFLLFSCSFISFGLLSCFLLFWFQKSVVMCITSWCAVSHPRPFVVAAPVHRGCLAGTQCGGDSSSVMSHQSANSCMLASSCVACRGRHVAVWWSARGVSTMYVSQHNSSIALTGEVDRQFACGRLVLGQGAKVLSGVAQGICPSWKMKLRTLAPWPRTSLPQVMSPTSTTSRRHSDYSDDVTIGKMLSDACRRRADHSEEEGLSSCLLSSVSHDSTGRRCLLHMWFTSFECPRNSETQLRKWTDSDSSGTTKRADSRWLSSRDSKTRIPGWLWQKKYSKVEWNDRVAKKEICRAHQGDERLRQDHQLLHEQLLKQNWDLREAHEKSLSEVEELKRFQGSTFDTISKRKLVEDGDTILELTGKIQELQNEINCMNDSRDFQDAESVRSGISHVPSQPVRFSHLIQILAEC